MRAIKQFLIFFLLLQAATAKGQSGIDSFDLLVNKLGQKLLDEKNGIGLSVGIYHNGNASFFNWGTTEAAKLNKPTQNTIYEIGSITKTFESYILANAVLEGRIKLEDDIRLYVTGKYPNLEFQGHCIRIVHLANTTSLLPDWLPALPPEMKDLSPDSALAVKIRFYKNLSKKDLFDALHEVKLDTIPGTKRYHSNAGAQLLSYILENVYKMSMEDLIKKYITKPQKMDHTFFITSSKQKKIATGYTASGKKAVYEYSLPYFKYAGGLTSTTGNCVKYIALMLSNSQPSVLSLKKTADINASTGKLVPMKPEGTASPEVYSTSLNWFKYQPDSNYCQIWADGGTNGFNSYLALYPYQNCGIVILANKSDEKIFRSLPGLASQILKLMEKK